ncbi:MAG: hypothetical protein K5839_05350 [Treponemataceae bacterium]|nr:hypothetical protein [Treponemataceae bacterium]
MKKSLFLAFAFLLALTFTGCLSTPDVDEFADWGTPEDSVLVYGSILEANEIVFTQMDPEFPADYQHANLARPSALSTAVFFLKPVAPGSRYSLLYMYYIVRSGQYVYYYNVYGPLTGTIYDFAVPSKPGLYYYGTISAQTSSYNGEKSFPALSLTSEEKAKENCLKTLAKRLKGSAWEQVILDELEASK